MLLYLDPGSRFLMVSEAEGKISDLLRSSRSEASWSVDLVVHHHDIQRSSDLLQLISPNIVVQYSRDGAYWGRQSNLVCGKVLEMAKPIRLACQPSQ